MRTATAAPLWHDTLPQHERERRRPALPGPTDADVVIIGGGFTGLWTAYSLLRHDPHRRVVVLEARTVGAGASGKNGGWCSALLPMHIDAVAAASSVADAVRFQREMFATVDEVGRVIAAEGIDCGFRKGGWIDLARSDLQWTRAASHVEHLRSYGFGEDDHRLLGPAETSTMVDATDTRGAVFTPHCAALDPARLVRGLADAVERLGGTVHDDTPVTEIRPGAAITHRGAVTAPVVLRATEAFTIGLPGHRRTYAPVYSLMIATEPLPDDVWARIGLADRPTFSDGRHMVIYGQRTADGRLAFGGRGAPYHFGSSLDPRHETNETVHDALHRTLRDLFPAIGDARITHRWGGAVAAARDWWCSVTFDRTTGLGHAGGYVGDGVGTSNLAGRTLADLVDGVDSDLVALPWVDHRSPRWEPEPLRWLGVNAMVRLSESIDRHEGRHGTEARWRHRVFDHFVGG